MKTIILKNTHCREKHNLLNHLLHLASKIIETDRLHLFLLSGGTRIDDNEYLSSLEDSTELIACTG